MSASYSSMSTIRLNSWLHPKMEPVARKLHANLIAAYETKRVQFRFEIFETFRFPDRQAYLLKQGTTKAGPWQSAHQVGLAVDFVPYLSAHEAYKSATERNPSGLPGWFWPDADHPDWAFLQGLAKAEGMVTIEWDKPHVEHPLFKQLRKIGF